METKNIWHTGTEIPNGKDRYIFKWKDHNSYKLVRGKEWVENRLQSPTGFKNHIERWAYIKDLESICEQLQQEPIDWEQRRYEIAKEMLRTIYIEMVKRNAAQTQALSLSIKVWRAMQGKPSDTLTYLLKN